MKDKGFTDKVKGKVKEVAGNISGNKELKSEAILDQVVGKAKDVTSTVKDVVDEAYEKVQKKLDK